MKQKKFNSVEIEIVLFEEEVVRTSDIGGGWDTGGFGDGSGSGSSGGNGNVETPFG